MRIIPRFEPLADLPYLSARSGGGAEVLRFELLSASIDTLPEGLDALLVASDLQGRAPSTHTGESVLLGVAFAEQLALWSADGIVPPLSRLGVILAGDLYAAPQADKRGATGDVREVWEAMDAMGLAFVTGVAGNHDQFGTGAASPRFAARYGLLDGIVRSWTGGLQVGGVAGIIGDNEKYGRRPQALFEELLERVLVCAPDIVVLHEGPPGMGYKQWGNKSLFTVFQRYRYDGLVICGHTNWRAPLAEMGAAQVLNVEGRAVLLTR